MERVLLLFLRRPEPGRVKTRLARDIGEQSAAAAYQLMVETVVRQLPPDLDLRICHTPREPEVAAALREWLIPLLPQPPERVSFTSQVEGDLGARLMMAFSEAFAAGYQRAAVMGSDCLDITPEILERTWLALAEADVVIGPAQDGGYYLLALKSPEHCGTVFQEIPWSSEETLAATLAAAQAAHLKVTLLPTKSDIDTALDWARAATQHGLPLRPVWKELP